MACKLKDGGAHFEKFSRRFLDAASCGGIGGGGAYLKTRNLGVVMFIRGSVANQSLNNGFNFSVFHVW